MFNKKVIVPLVALVVVAAVAVTVKVRGSRSEGVEVQIAPVGRDTIVQTVTATGKIQPKTQVNISADVSAKITRLEVEEGDWVEKGAFLLELDRERYLAAVESAEANLRAAQANVNLCRENMIKAEKDFDRMEQLYRSNLESQAMLDTAHATAEVEKARYQSAVDQMEQARAALKQARDALSKTTIYSPLAGTVSQLNKEVGEIALGSQFQEDVVMVVSNLAGMEALVDVDENDIVLVAMGDGAEVEVDALPDMVQKGEVTEIANSANVTGEGTTDQKTEFEVKLAIVDPVEQLRPGMTASSDIVIETRDSTLCVPIQCVTVRTPEQLESKNPKKDGGNIGDAHADSTSEPGYKPDKDGFVTVIFVVAEGYARAVQVDTGIQSDTHIEIVEGLAEGDEVVSGSYRAISQTLGNDMAVIAKREEKKED